MKIRKMSFVCVNLLVSILLMGGVTGCGYSNENQEVVIAGEIEDTSSVDKMEPELKELNVTVKPEKISYFVDETLETGGMVLEAVFSDGSTSVVEDGFSCSPMELTQAGSQEITVSYEGLTTAFTVNVEEAVKVTNVAIADLPDTTTYMVGQKLDQNGLALEVKYSDGSREVIRQEFQCEPTELTEVGRQDIVLTYEGKDVTFEVNVVEKFVFENMIIKCLSVGNDKFPGVNKKGQLVNWCLEIQFDLSDKMRYMFDPRVTDCSWGHVVNGDEFEYEVDFEDANNGVTYAEFAIMSRGGYAASGTSAFMAMIHLPDDPSIAGEQSVTIQVGNVKKVFSFNLTYEGDYENGTGWSISNIRY